MWCIISQIRKNVGFLVVSLLLKVVIISIMLVTCIKISLIIALDRRHFFGSIVTECKKKNNNKNKNKINKKPKQTPKPKQNFVFYRRYNNNPLFRTEPLWLETKKLSKGWGTPGNVSKFHVQRCTNPFLPLQLPLE